MTRALLLVAAAGLVACAEETLVGVTPGVDLEVLAGAGLPADGRSSATLVARLPGAIPGDAVVTFATTSGTFLGSGGPTRSIRADDGVARATYVVGRSPGTATLSVWVDPSRPTTVVVPLAEATPDSVLLSASTDRGTVASPVALTARLVREVGRPSLNTLVTMEGLGILTADGDTVRLGGVAYADSLGRASFAVTLPATGSVSLTASAGGVSSRPLTIRFH